MPPRVERALTERTKLTEKVTATFPRRLLSSWIKFCLTRAVFLYFSFLRLNKLPYFIFRRSGLLSLATKSSEEYSLQEWADIFFSLSPQYVLQRTCKSLHPPHLNFYSRRLIGCGLLSESFVFCYVSEVCPQGHIFLPTK